MGEKASMWNLWHGCHKLSEGCRHCYVYRTDGKYGKDSSMVTKTEKFDLPLLRKKNGTYKIPSGNLVYTCFTSDFLIEDADEWRAEAWEMMRIRQDLRFLFITKRIDRLQQCLPPDWGDGYENVTICCTMENQDRVDYRLPIYREIPIKHKIIICEPLLSRIDFRGELGDWDAVKKYDAVCPNDAHNECISKTAMMFDGDYVYVYVKDGTGGDASGAGTHSNGRYSITTDLGYELVFQLDSKGYVNGVDGVDCRHVGNQWEIAVPKSALPAYNKTISFGLYRSEPFISGTANIKDDGSSDDKIIYDIRYDGLYGDWEYYPHTTIQYSTAGAHHNMVDSAGALFSNGSTVLGHVYTVMPEHLNEAGGEFTQAVTFKFNDSYNQVLYPRFVTVDEQGNINWNPKSDGLSDGTYEFYMFDTSAWGTSKNINELNDADICYGKMIVTVGSNRDECEFYFDLDKVAQKLGCDVSDFKQISAQFGRLGQEWINTAGASSGAWLGLFICIAGTCGVVVYKKKKGSIQV